MNEKFHTHAVGDVVSQESISSRGQTGRISEANRRPAYGQLGDLTLPARRLALVKSIATREEQSWPKEGFP